MLWVASFCPTDRYRSLANFSSDEQRHPDIKPVLAPNLYCISTLHSHVSTIRTCGYIQSAYRESGKEEIFVKAIDRSSVVAITYCYELENQIMQSEAVAKLSFFKRVTLILTSTKPQ